MKTWLLALAPWMVVASVTAQTDGPRPAEVVFTHYGKISTNAWQDGLECFVPIEAVSRWGWKATLGKSDLSIAADSRTIKLPFRRMGGRTVISLGQAVKKLGGGSGWLPGTGTFQVWSFVRSVKVRDGNIEVEVTLPLRPRLSFEAQPDRLVLDFHGAKLDSKVYQELEAGSRVGQFEETTVRVVVETSKRPAYQASEIKASRSFSLNYGDAPEVPNDENELGTTLPKPPETNKLDPPQGGDLGSFGGLESPMPEALVAKVGVPELSLQNERKAIITIRPIGKLISPPQLRRVEANVIELTMPGASYEGELEPKLESPFIKQITVTQGPASAIYTFVLNRPMGVVLSSTNGAQISLVQPAIGDGRLSSKTIVVDAGHGGHDGGAKAPNGSVYEKNLTLAIAKELASALIDEGSTVIMTRDTDVFIPLKERAEIANRNSADFFISVHINSSVRNSSNGGMTFFHAKDPICQLLAECIQAEIAKVSKLKDHGAWSDQRIYDTGFAVLRLAQMPAVLIEMGFINNDFDRKRMITKDFHADVAEAIVKGLKVYLGNENP